MPGQFPKDYHLNKIILYPVSGKSVELRFKMIELNTYESLWNTSVVATLSIHDAENMLATLPIIGFERLEIDFETPDKEPFHMFFRVRKVTDRKLQKERQMFYTLHLIAEEDMKNLTTRVSKSYKGKLLHEIVSDLHTNWLGGGPIYIEPTKLLYHVIIPNLHPMEAIQWINTRSNAAAYEGANYLYYQDKKQFNYIPIEKKLEQEPKLILLSQMANIRKYQDMRKPRDLGPDSRAVETYEFESHFDILHNLMEGMYGSELLRHDTIKKLWKRDIWTYPDTFDKYKHLYPGNYLYSDGKGDLAKKEARLKLYPVGHNPPYPFNSELWEQPRISQLQQLDTVRVSFTIPGDSSLTVGDVIQFNMPSPEKPVDKVQVIDKYYTGKFLITGCRHIIDENEYVTNLECVKDSTKVKFP